MNTPETIREKFYEWRTQKSVSSNGATMQETADFFLAKFKEREEGLREKIEKIWEKLPHKSLEDSAYNFKEKIDVLLSDSTKER